MSTTQTTAQIQSAQARAGRESRRSRPAPSPRALEAAGDALLPPYDLKDDYPALTSRNMDRREQRDAERRTLAVNEWGDGGDGHGPVPSPPNPRTASAPVAYLPGGNVNDANFNRITPSGGVAGAALASQSEAEIESILDALGLSARDRRAVEMRLAGKSLSEIADEFGTRKQNVDRWLDNVGKRLFLFWLDDQNFGMASVYRSEGIKSVNRAVSGSRTPAPASVCDCASQQFRVQRVKDQPGEFTWHCCNCKKKMDREEFAALRQGGNTVWGS